MGVRHGDIKSENVVVTSWNWLFLTDIAFYKPTLLPADNPADYTHFFDTGQRRRCYLAPERFYQADKKAAAARGEGGGGGGGADRPGLGLGGKSAADSQITEQMDIFSAVRHKHVRARVCIVLIVDGLLLPVASLLLRRAA